MEVVLNVLGQKVILSVFESQHLESEFILEDARFDLEGNFKGTKLL